MGVEWHIGCIKCKRQIWLGSQKPHKWQGFQIGDEIVKRFLSLHAGCDNLDGNLLLTNDGTVEIPWETDNEISEWKEDILSRSFCFDSWHRDTIICASCGKTLSRDESLRRQHGNLMKNPLLWFCNEKCFSNYIESTEKERGQLIYDSTKDPLPPTIKGLFEIGCTKCKTYIAIDNKKDSFGKTKNFEYLALFLCEHVGNDHILKLNIDNQHIPWREIGLGNDWTEYEY